MNDCPNGDVRDLLPDLLHERLDPASRAMVVSHVDGCADCRAELALLRDLHASIRQASPVDAFVIAAAVPPYRAPTRRSWVGWRTAAAITVVVAGGSSLLLMQRDVLPESRNVAVAPPSENVVQPMTIPSVSVPVTPPVAPAPTQPRDSQPVVQPPAQGPTPVAVGGELAMAAGSLTDLSDQELTSLLKEIEMFDAVPGTDVESAALSPIAPASRRVSP